MSFLISVIFIFMLGRYSDSANILYVVPFTSKSHHILLKPIGLELARRGHNVTVITGHRDPNSPPNYRQVMIDNKEIWDVLGERPNVFDMVEISAEKFHKKVLWDGGVSFTELILNSTEVRQLFAGNNKFDLVINEQFFQEATNVLAYKYNCPLIFVTSFGNCMRYNIVTRNPLQLATVLSEFLDVEEPTSFWARLRNLYFTVYEYIYWRYIYLNQQENLVQKYFPDLPKPVPSLYELQKNASLMLINGHFSFDVPAAYLPNIVEIGGIHLNNSETKLPEDLQNILDSAKNGVIYMNFGSNIRSSELPVEKRNTFLNVFSKLNQTVLWKWEDDTLENKLPNVIVRKWLPQKEILAHPNLKIFISHGGLIGTQEAVFHGVPIIGIPIYADQYNNLLLTEYYGFGKILQYHNISEDTLSSIINEMLSNDFYRKNALEISVRFKDRPLSPLDTAMYWIEYVLRHKGAEHIKNPARKMNWLVYNMLDVYACILMVAFVIVFVLFKVLLLITHLVRTQRSIRLKKKEV